MNLGSALLGLLISIVGKGLVMVLTARLLIRLYRTLHAGPPGRTWLLLPDEQIPPARILWWSLVLFGASELTCGIEMYILLRSSPILSGFHAVASGLAMGIFALSLFDLLEGKLFRYGGPVCLLNRFCRGCTIGETPGCKYRPLFLIIATFVALAAIAPLFASTARMDADPRAFLIPFPPIESWYLDSFVPWLRSIYPAYDPLAAAYYLSASELVIEFRLLPLIAGLSSLVGIQKLLGRRELAGLRFVAFAAGVLCYSLFELVCYRGTGDILAGSLLHEAAELWFLVATSEFLIRSFPPERPGPPLAEGSLSEAP